jgi:hypothetical protein
LGANQIMLLLMRRIGQHRGVTRAAYEARRGGDAHESVAFLIAALENKSDKPQGAGGSAPVIKRCVMAGTCHQITP